MSARPSSTLLYLTVTALILGWCTASQTPESGDTSDEVRSTSQPLSTTTDQLVSTTTSIGQAVPTTVTSTLPVMDYPPDKKPELIQEEEISTTTTVRAELPTEPTLDLDEPVTLDSETRPEITYMSELPPAGFRGVLYSDTYTQQPTIDFQFLDAETNSVSSTEVTASPSYPCTTYLSTVGDEWNLLYDDYDAAADPSIRGYIIRGNWGEMPIAVPIMSQEYDSIHEKYSLARSQFDSAQYSFVLTNYFNGFSLDVNGVVREYHVQPWNISQYVHQDGEIIPSKEARPSKSEPNKGLVSEVPGMYSGWGASLHGTDGELLAISIRSSEPACGSRFVYFVSMVTGEIVYCTWTNAKFLLVAPSDQEAILDEIRLPPSGWFSNEPCTNDETDLADLAAVLETRGGRLDN